MEPGDPTWSIKISPYAYDNDDTTKTDIKLSAPWIDAIWGGWYRSEASESSVLEMKLALCRETVIKILIRIIPEFIQSSATLILFPTMEFYRILSYIFAFMPLHFELEYFQFLWKDSEDRLEYGLQPCARIVCVLVCNGYCHFFVFALLYVCTVKYTRKICKTIDPIF